MLGLSFLDELGQEFFVVGSSIFGKLVAFELDLFVQLLPSDSLVSHESLDLRGLVESLVTFLDLASHHILSHVVGFTEGEDFADGGGSFRAESAGLFSVSNTGNLLLSFLDNSQSDHREIGAGDASSDTLSLALSLSFLSES